MKTKITFILLFLLYTFSYISAQDLAFESMIMEEWKNNAWRNLSRVSNTYDTNQNLIKQYAESWDTIGIAWVKYMQATNTLNPNGTVNQTVTQLWNKESNTWIDYSKSLYTYDAAKQMLTATMQMSMGGSMIDIAKTSYTYENGKLIKEIDQTLNFQTMTLLNNSQSSYTYNADGTENQVITQGWNGETLAWETDGRTTYSYNQAKKVILVLNEEYFSGTWQNSSRTSYSYNADGTNNEMTDEEWNVSMNRWDKKWKDVFSYIPVGILKELLTMEWNTILSNWENESRYTFTYKTTSIEKKQLAGSGSVIFYPNPFTNTVNVQSSGEPGRLLEIYNTDGKLVAGEPLNGSRHILNLEEMKPGIYYFRVHGPDGSQVMKMVKAN